MLVRVPCSSCRLVTVRARPDLARCATCASCRTGDAPAAVIEATIAAWEAAIKHRRRLAL